MSSFRLVNEQVRSNAIAAVKAAEIGGEEVLVVSIDAEKKRANWASIREKLEVSA